MIRYAASAGSPCFISCLPGSNPTRSLIKASNLSFAGSISAKIGTRRSNSNSCFRLISSLPSSSRCPFACSFGGYQQRHQRPVTFELDWGALFLQLSVAQNDDPVEISGEARPMQYPDNASPREFFPQPFGHPRLRQPVERRGRFVEDQKIGAFEHRPGDPRLLPLGERQARSSGTDVVIEPDINHGFPER